MDGEQETASDLRRLHTGQAGLWPGAGSGGIGGRQAEGAGGESPQATPALFQPVSVVREVDLSCSFIGMKSLISRLFIP